MSSVRGSRPRVRVGAPDPSLTAVSGMAAISELCDRLRVVEALDAAVGPIKQRDRGFTAGELMVALACAQWAGEDFLVGLDRQREDLAGQMIAPVPGLCSTTAAGLARRVNAPQWMDVEAGVGRVTERVLAGIPAQRRSRLCSTVTIDLDATDVEVYGRKKRGVAYNHQGQRCGRPHVATWAETETVLAAELVSGHDDPRAGAAMLLRRALATLPRQARKGRVRLRADAGYFAGERRTSIENVFRDSKHGAALRHLPSGHAEVNAAWMWGALLAATMAGWLHQLTAVEGPTGRLSGWGTREGKAMIATLRHRLIRIPARVVSHAGQLILRLPPGQDLLAELLDRLRALPVMP